MKFRYKCTDCKKEGLKFGLCSKKGCQGLMIKKDGCETPELKGWQSYHKGDKCNWRNRRHN